MCLSVFYMPWIGLYSVIVAFPVFETCFFCQANFDFTNGFLHVSDYIYELFYVFITAIVNNEFILLFVCAYILTKLQCLFLS